MTVETRRIGGRRVERIHGEPTTVEFTAGMMIDADGALRAYHPDDAPGLDRLEHAGAPGNWWGVVDGRRHAGRRARSCRARAIPAPGFYVSQTSLDDPAKEPDDPRRYVDALAVPYLALQEVFVRELGCKLGDFAWVTREEVGGVAARVGGDLRRRRGAASSRRRGIGRARGAARHPVEPAQRRDLSRLGSLRALLRIGQRTAAPGRGDRRGGRATRRRPARSRRRGVPASLRGH